MTSCVLVRVTLLTCLLMLSLSGCRGQRDCTGVDCPKLENCIDESLESGACCASCRQKGCACQGYQYYDCVSAGFMNGKVPEGRSYFVDFGSTECSCPEGGGRISCHFIPCPDIPANCIELSEPADGCIQCKRIGCVHNEQQYEAGHSFHMDPCQVCHCPNDGGSLMCYPIPDCDPRRVEKPMLAATTEENTHEKLRNNPLQFIFQHQGPREPFSKPFRLAQGDTLPLLTQHPNNLEDDEEGDYDYPPTDTPGPPLQDLVAPTESSIISVSRPESDAPRLGLHRKVKQELREMFAVQHEATRHAETTQAPATLQQTTPQHHGEVTTASWQKALENQVLPLETIVVASHGKYTDGSDADGDVDWEQEEGVEEEEEEEEGERMVTSHDFTVFPQRESHAFSFADHRPSKKAESRPVMPEISSFADPVDRKTTQTRPVTEEKEIDRDRSSSADHGRDRDTHSRPAVEEVDQDSGTFAQNGYDRKFQTRPVMEELDRHWGTFSEHGQSRITESRPIKEERDRDRETSSQYGQSRTTDSRPIKEERERDRETSSQYGQSRTTDSRPIKEERDRDRETSSQYGQSRTTESRPIKEERERDRGTFPHHGHDKISQTRPVTAETDRDKGSSADYGYNKDTLSRPVMEGAEQDRRAFTEQGHGKTAQGRPVQDKADQDQGKGHKPWKPSSERSERLDGSQEHVTPPALNFADHTTRPQRLHQIHTLPAVPFFTTSRPPPRGEADGGRHPARNQSKALTQSAHVEKEQEREREREEERDNSLSSLPVDNRGSFAMMHVERCCEVGKKWATEHHHCNRMPTTPDDSYILCSVVQEQCCTGALRQSRCWAGMSAARGGDVCQAPPDGRHCGEDSYQECCSCCSLGLQLREAGLGCHAHQHLDYPCGHILLTCCEEEEVEEEGSPGGHVPDGPALKRKMMPRPRTTPQKVSDRKFPKEAFTAGTGEDAGANSLEETRAVDACQKYAARLCHHICINTWGSYQCGCRPGHVLLQDGHTCAPEDAEEDNRVHEEERPVTQTTFRLTTSTPSFSTAVTPTTTSTTTQNPLLFNPCAGNGPCAQRCSVARGRATCSCFPGFSLMADGHSCEDVDECMTNTHTCRPSERCVNTLGAFVCERQISCSSGYQARNGVCEDINECVTRTHNCGPTMECKNTDGSFSCVPKQRCYTGFTQDAHGNCIDIDECSSLAEPCSSGFNCINTVGSYTCQRKVIMCGAGYHASPDGARCMDVDECQTGIHRCGEGQVCQNVPGSYRCNCQTGYQYDAVRQTCVDVNECWRYPGRLCSQTCENTPGSYQCSCTAGFALAFDGKNCEDLNECDTNPCSQECANIYGSYQCYCRQGFYLKEDGHTCEDIDECSQSIGHLCAFQCVNVPGSYQCACPPSGYTISTNGRTCRDIDECAIGSHNCSLSESCYNIQGGFRCLSFSCPPNYRKVSDTRCERVSCLNVPDCQSSPLRITYYQLSFQTNIVIPAQIFRIGPSPAYAGDSIMIGITRGNEEGYFSTRRLNGFTGAVYLQRQVAEPRDFFIDVEMKLLRQGTFTTFVARIYVFITASAA